MTRNRLPSLNRPGPARGLGALAIIGVLVLMAALAAAVLRFSVQGASVAQQDADGALASAAARAGLDYGLYKAFRGSWSSCASTSTTLVDPVGPGMRVTVSCNSIVYNEGESAPGTPQPIRVFTIDAVACNGGSSCPDATAVGRPGYVERRRQVQAVN